MWFWRSFCYLPRSSFISKMTTTLKEVACYRSFDGFQYVYTHESSELQCTMRFALYMPPQSDSSSVPIIYWLSGLTCSEQNFIQKSGVQRLAALYGFAVVCPDTSPRGCNIPGEDDSWDFGTGAGFYVDATQPPFDKNYRMYSYVTKELPALLSCSFPVDMKKQSIMGHSMGGHGAIICALKNPKKYRAVSAFAPVCNPTVSPWGRKALAGYLGIENQELWKKYDATCLVANYAGPPIEILIDQGVNDEFIHKGQLLTGNLLNACNSNLVQIKLRMREGYDHSYYFISTYLEEHFEFHAKYFEKEVSLI